MAAEMHLRWAIKTSLLDYVRAMDDGRVETADGALVDEDTFRFPAAPNQFGDEWRFTGRVTLQGHHGLLDLSIAEPWLVPHEGGWLLSIADPYDPQGRLAFARVPGFSVDRDGVRTGMDAELTSDGADLFFGPYVAGTPVDPPAVVRSPAVASDDGEEQ